MGVRPRHSEPGARPATIHDVAEAAAVAVGTVSRYLNGRPIRAANRLKVEQAVAELGFVRNLAAAAIRNEASRLVGFLVSSYDAFQIELLSQLTDHLQAADRLVLPLTHDGSPELTQRALQFFAEHRVDAVIASGDFERMTLLATFPSLAGRLILFNNDLPALAADRVFFDDVQGAERATAHLVALGHRRIGLISGLPAHSSAANRLAGYRQALAAGGVGYDPRLVVGHGWSPDVGYRGLQELLALPQPPTALLCANQPTAMGALELVAERNLKIPDQLSIVSYGDADVFRLVRGGIDAVVLPIRRMANGIEQIYLGRTGDGPQRLVLPCDLILRGSTGAPS